MAKVQGCSIEHAVRDTVQGGLVALTLLAGSYSCHANRPAYVPPADLSSQITADLPPLSRPDPLGMKELNEVRPVYEVALTESEVLLKKGRLAEATQRLLDVVPENTRTAAQNLHLGNLLFGPNPAQSYPLHLEAFRQLPDSANTNLEAAFELLRAGKSRDAGILFERYLAWNPNHKQITALWAYCLLEQGDLRRAVDAWNHADHRNLHVEIDEAISTVFGLRSPWLVRSELMGKVSGENAGSALGELLRHDLEWPIDWWSSKPSLDLAREDLAALGGQVEPDVRESMKVLVDAAEGYTSPANELRERVRERLETQGKNLPTQVLRGLADFGIRGKMVTDQEVANWLRPVMEHRAFSAAASADDADFFAEVCLGYTDGLCADIERVCWEKFKGRVCAESHFIELAKVGKLTLGDPDFQAALKAFPESSFLHLAALELTPKGGPEEQEALRRVILADYHNLSLGNGIRESYGIKAFFSRLEQSLGSALQ